MAGQLAPVIQPEEDFVLHQLHVDAGHTALQASVQLHTTVRSSRSTILVGQMVKVVA